jgi:hypothetical protein
LSYGNLIKTIEQQIQDRQQANERNRAMVEELKQVIKDFDNKQPIITANGQAQQQPALADFIPAYQGYVPDISIADDVDDEVIHGRNRRRSRQARTNTR